MKHECVCVCVIVAAGHQTPLLVQPVLLHCVVHSYNLSSSSCVSFALAEVLAVSIVVA